MNSVFWNQYTGYIPKTPVTVIYLEEVLQRQRNNYSIHKTHSDLISGNGYVNIQDQKDRDKAVIKKS